MTCHSIITELPNGFMVAEVKQPARKPLFVARFCSILIALLATTLVGSAAAPANDLCTGAEIIPTNLGFPVWTTIRDISGATTNGDPAGPTCVATDFLTNLLRSVWYTFTPAISRHYTISSCANAPTATTVSDTTMAIYTSGAACLGPMVEISDGCADEACGPGFSQAAITAPLQAGTNYYIVVWRYGTDVPSPDNSSLQLRVDFAAPPLNDTCEGAVPLTLNRPISGSTVLATNDYQVPLSCFPGSPQQFPFVGAGRDVAYSFTAPATNDYSFRLSNFNTSNGDDPLLYVINGCPTGPKPISISAGNCLAAANHARYGNSEEIYCLHLNAGQQVYVIVDDAYSDPAISASSSFVLEVSLCNRESEPGASNNGTTTANAIMCGLEGTINSSGDVDMFSVGTPNNGWRLFAMLDGGALGPSSDLSLRVITLNGTLEFDGKNNDRAFGDLSSNVAGTPLTNVPTYLRVNRPLGSAAEPYRLYAVIQPPLANATHETEPNNLLGQANSAANNYFFGTLSSGSDMDSYQFDAEEGDVVFVSLGGDPYRTNSPFNAKLELLDENGNFLVSVDDDESSLPNNQVNTSTNLNDYPNVPGEALVTRVANTATYFVRVSVSHFASGGAASGGDYLLSIARNCTTGSNGQANQPTITSVGVLPNGHYQLNAVGTPGVTYRVMATSLLGSNWSVLPGSARVANGDGTLQFEDPNALGQQRFYKLVWP